MYKWVSVLCTETSSWLWGPFLVNRILPIKSFFILTVKILLNDKTCFVGHHFLRGRRFSRIELDVLSTFFYAIFKKIFSHSLNKIYLRRNPKLTVPLGFTMIVQALHNIIIQPFCIICSIKVYAMLRKLQNMALFGQ